MMCKVYAGSVLFVLSMSTTIDLYGEERKDSAHLLHTFTTYHQGLNSGMFKLIQMSRKIDQPNRAETTVDIYQLQSTDCALFEELGSDIQITGFVPSGEMNFQVIEESSFFIRLKNDDATFWVAKSCVRLVSSGKNNTGFPFFKEEHNWWYMVEETYKRQHSLYEEYRRFKRKNESKIQKLPSLSQRNQIGNLIVGIERKKLLIDQLYQRLRQKLFSNEKRDSYAGNPWAIRANVMFGSSNYHNNTAGVGTQQSSSGNTDVNIQARYRLNAKSRLAFQLNNRTETRVTTYSTTDAGVNYHGQAGNMKYQANLGFQNYSDKDISSRDFKKLNFGGSLSKNTGKGVNYRINYRYLEQIFDQHISNSYIKHDFHSVVGMATKSKYQPSASVAVWSGSSDNSVLQYTVIRTGFSMLSKEGPKRSEFSLLAEATGFPQTTGRTNERYQFKYSLMDRTRSGTRFRQEITAIFRSFPENEISNYADLSYRQGRNQYGESRKGMGLLFRMRYFPLSLSASHFDLTRSVDKAGRRFFTRHVTNIRIGYPGEDYFLTSLNGFIKAGLKWKAFRIGPTFNWRYAIDFVNDEALSNDSGLNYYRLGFETSGNYLIKRIIKLNFRASYDVDNINIWTSEADMPWQGLTHQNPVNIQFAGYLGYLIKDYAEVYLRAQMFDRQTYYDDEVAPTPQFTSNGSVNFKLGFKIRYH